MPGDGPVDGVGAGGCTGAQPVDSAGGSLVVMTPDVVNPLLATPPRSACQKRGRRRANKRRDQREALLSLAAPVPTPQEDLSGAHVPLESGSHLTPPIPTPLHEAVEVRSPGLGHEGWRRANRRKRDRWRSRRANATAASFLQSSSPLSSDEAGPVDPPSVPLTTETGELLGSGSGGAP